ASHFARQEAVILFSLIFSFYYYTKHKSSMKKPIFLGIVTGLNIGIHPNSLFIAALVGSLYLFDVIFLEKSKLKELMIYIFVTGIFAATFIATNLYFDPNFFSNYKEFGDQFNVFAQPADRISEIRNFYLKLYYQVSGTYYIPNIKFQMLFFPVVLVFSIGKIIFTKNFLKYRVMGLTIFAIIAINITYIVIGRYNQTSIIFVFPFFWMLLVLNVKNIKYNNILLLSIALLVLFISIFNITPFLNSDYENYLENISSYVDDDEVVLVNLNTEYYFSNNSLYDYRNLHYLKENNMTFSEYVEKNNIKYIIYPEEMDFIYNTRPVWNFIYGNLYYYYEDMQHYLENNCQLVYRFDSPYAMRLSMYMYKESWSVKIYKVIN
ncbi:MAG: 4-amino-4-deoxy-L-arabinose transferase, partial [Bacillota bacterium]|nr:4-amino-4-deoxy-L-arabinose transferase [Bacillota bacterium]